MSEYSKDSLEFTVQAKEYEKASFLVQQGASTECNSRTTWTRPLLLISLNFTILICSILVLSTTIFYQGTRSCNYMKDGRNTLLKQTSHWSPILDQLEIPLEEVHIDGAFFEAGNDSIYRQLPNHEVDAAWERISTVGQVFLTTEEVIRLGKDPTITVRENDGPGRHIGLMNGFHEIHCLNVIRQNLHRDYYFPQGIRSPHHWIHLYHCLNVVLQALKCSANTDIVTYNWVEDMGAPVFDFSINRKCRDFDRLMQWQTETMKPIESYSFHREGWEKQLPAPEQLERIKSHDPKTWKWSKTDPAFFGSIDEWFLDSLKK